MKRFTYFLLFALTFSCGCSDDPGESEVPITIQRNTDFDDTTEGLDP